VAWLPPGSTVPESVGKEPFVLESRALRGVISNGMLASARELALGDDHAGILEIDGDVTPGTDFADQYNLAGDVVFDIENKMFTHRPDCFGYLGVARELAGIQNMPFKSPDWYRTDAEVPAIEAEPLALEVRNEIPDLVPRFTAVALRDVQVGPSPVWLQTALARVGVRPISNIVDLTNFFMLETGQPLHAYDYDKVAALDGNSGDDGNKATLVVRHPQAGEKITLLNGKEIEPRPEAIMIASATKLIGVGGVMGGADTEVDATTKNIILEAATFDMYSIRRTSMAHGLFTDAVTRFNKGQSPLQNRAVLAKIVDDIRRLAGGKVASELADDNHMPLEVQERQSVYAPVTLTADFINARLGLQLNLEAIAQLLTNVEFDVTLDSGANSLIVKTPFWRTDIEIPEDVVEEVGRLYGFDHLPLDLPVRAIMPAAKNLDLEVKQMVRDILSQAGANEVSSYSFVHGNLLQKTGQDPMLAYKLDNALSPDLQYFRLSLTPSLLERVHPNIKAGYETFGLFEIGKAHVKGRVDETDRTDGTESGLPSEFERVALVIAADAKAAQRHEGAPYYQARVCLDQLLQSLQIAGELNFQPQAADDPDVAAAYYAPGRSARVMVGNQIIGRIGEYKPSVRKALKLPDYVAGFELSIPALVLHRSTGSVYIPLSRYPAVEQDICLKVAAGRTYGEVRNCTIEALAGAQSTDMRSTVSPVDVYQREAGYKQITLRVRVVDYAKTLRDSEVVKLLDHVAQVAKEKLDAERI
jgi:phenylalanyl-tRNA synthetase beta chain